MRLRDWNLRQRIVVVIGLGLVLLFLGRWITTRGRFTGWVAYAPLSRGVHTVGGAALHPGLRLLILGRAHADLGGGLVGPAALDP